MIAIISFKDGDEEPIKNVRVMTEFDEALEIRAFDCNVIRYQKKDIQKIEIVWR
jgi:hypothetical protein